MVEELLQEFDFCLDYGFVIKDPLQRLDSYFDPWTELVLQLDDIRCSYYLLCIGMTPYYVLYLQGRPGQEYERRDCWSEVTGD